MAQDLPHDAADQIVPVLDGEAVQIIGAKAAEQARVPGRLAAAVTGEVSRVVDYVGKLVPDLLRLIQQVRGEQAFHVVMRGNIGDLKTAGNGLVHAWTQGANGRFGEQALLRAADFDPAALLALSDLATKAMLLQIAVKIDEVHETVRHVAGLIRSQQLGRLVGAIGEYKTIQALIDEDMRHQRINILASAIRMEVGAAQEILAADLLQMPESTTHIVWDGWGGSQQEQLANQWKDHARTLALIFEGMRVAVLCNLEVGESGAALVASEDLLQRVRSLDLQSAASKASALTQTKGTGRRWSFWRMLCAGFVQRKGFGSPLWSRM